MTSVKGPDGKSWSYQYDADNNLISVTPPSPQIGAKSYHYEDSSDRKLLTGFSVDGVRQTRYSYDGTARVTKSGDASGSGWGEDWESIA